MTFRVRETREENIGADFYPEAGTTAVAGCTRFIAVAAAAGLKAKEGDRKSDFDSLVHLVTQASRFGGERNLWKQEKENGSKHQIKYLTSKGTFEKGKLSISDSVDSITNGLFASRSRESASKFLSLSCSSL